MLFSCLIAPHAPQTTFLLYLFSSHVTSKRKYRHWLCLLLPTVSPHQSKKVVYSRIKEELESNKQEFTYAEVLSMTRNLERVVGKGGFGIVYHGCVGDIEVAVKMLSPSAQGYLQFQAEVV